MQVMLNTQKAIYALLAAELDEDIYDFVPEDALLPYVTIGDASLVHSPVLGKGIYEMQFSIHAYDNSHGRKNLLLIADAIFELLNGGELAVEDHTHHETKLLSQSIELTDEGGKYALQADYRIVVS